MPGLLHLLPDRGAGGIRHSVGAGSVLTAHLSIAQGRLSTLSATPGPLSAKLSALMSNPSTALGAHVAPSGGLLSTLGGSGGGVGGLFGTAGSGGSSDGATATDTAFAASASRFGSRSEPPAGIAFK